MKQQYENTQGASFSLLTPHALTVQESSAETVIKGRNKKMKKQNVDS